MYRLVSFSLSLVWTASRSSFVWLVVLQLAGAAVLAGQVFAVQWVLAGILDLGSESASVSALVLAVVALATLTALGAVVGSVQGSLSRFVGESVARSMWHRLLDVSTGVGLKTFESPEFFDRLDRVRTSALTRPFLVTNGVISVIGATAAGIGLAATLVAFHPVLLPLLLISGIPVLFTSRRESRLEFRFSVDQTQPMRQRAYTSLLLTGRDEAKEIRAFGLARTLRARFDHIYGRYLVDLGRHLRRRAMYSVIGQFTAALVLGATLLVLVWLITLGQISIAAAGAALVAVRMLSSQVQALAGGVQTIFESGLFIDDLREFISMNADDPHGKTAAEAREFSRIDVSDASFTYPGRDDPAVDGVSIRIGKGEVVALVGENGSGKTTLAKVVAGLYPVDRGGVFWDGQDVDTLPAGTLRASTAVIFQDFVRYAMSASTNIAFGKPDAAPDIDAVWAAAAASGASGFLSDLPDGLDTPLTRIFEGGRDLSGGQWQRMAIARAFYRDAPLVVLDEPSSALDPRAEYELYSSLRTVLRGRSALVISHRFSTVRNADRIYVLDEGHVTEQGTHDELMRLGGRYAELFRLQASAYLSDDSEEVA